MNTQNVSSNNQLANRSDLAIRPAMAMAHTPKGWGGMTVLQRVEHARRLAHAEGHVIGKPIHVGK